MNYVIERIMKFNRYEYFLKNSENVHAKTMHPLGIFLRKFMIHCYENKYVLKETNLILKWINCLPFIKCSKYYLMCNNEMIGAIVPRGIIAPGYELYVHNQKYTFILGKKNRIIVHSNNEEVAYICKRTITYNERNTYDIEIFNDHNSIINIIFIITIFSDIVFFPNRFHCSAIKYESTW